jgi:hypothetical protein
MKFTDEVISDVVSSLEAGETLAKVAARLDSTPESVRVTLIRKGIKFDFVKGRRWVVKVSDTAARAIREEAIKRGISSMELASEIVSAVSRDGLFSAVLDQ